VAVSDGTLIGGVGPNSGEIMAYNTSVPGTISIATVGGKTRFKADGTDGSSFSFGVDDTVTRGPSAIYRWGVAEIYITGTMSVGESLTTMAFGAGPLTVNRDYVSSTTFKLNCLVLNPRQHSE